MKINKTILTSVLTSVIIPIISVFGFLAFIYYFVPIFPVNLLDENGERMLGATITELSGTDTMSNFPTTYNANLNALNDGKIEVSTTSVASIITLANLSSVGTIGTGVWQGTAITVAYGGTATSTAVTNGVFFYNGSTYAQDTTNFVWDDTNKRLGIGSSTPVEELSINGQLYVDGTDTATSTIQGNIRFTNNAGNRGIDFEYGSATTSLIFW